MDVHRLPDLGLLIQFDVRLLTNGIVRSKHLSLCPLSPLW